MTQDLITYTLIASSGAYALIFIYRLIFPAKKGGVTGCAGCNGCQVKNPASKPSLETNRALSVQKSELHIPDFIHQVQNMRLPAK